MTNLFNDAMKKVSAAILLILLGSLLYAGAVIIEFKAEPQRDKIVLTWKTGTEDGVTMFVIERSVDNKHFTAIGQVPPKGSNSQYFFEDKNLSHFQSIFYYRLRIRNNNGQDQLTDALPVIPKLSSIERTWGSIKILFR